MSVLGRLTVLPNLPEPIDRLSELATNLYWSWEPQARALFRRLDAELWERSGYNPVAVLQDIPQERLEEAAGQQGITLHIAPLALCTDNAVMGAIAVERLLARQFESLDLDVYPGVVRKKN